jgi:hypothetical protein
MGVVKAEVSMRQPAVDMDLSLPQAAKARRAQGRSLLARLHWPRIIAFALALGMWPAIIFAVSRFL